MKFKIIITLLIVLLTSLLIPFPDVVVPQWRVRVQTSEGAPWKHVRIKQSWTNATTESVWVMHEEVEETDDDGFVLFPERTLITPLALRAAGAILAHIDFWSPSSYG